jgi:hypothetical protein
MQPAPASPSPRAGPWLGLLAAGLLGATFAGFLLIFNFINYI